VQVHVADNGSNDNEENGNNNWITVANPQKTYNILDLVNGAIEQLGVTDLEPGKYTQIRLYLGLLDPDGGTNLLGEAHLFPNYVIDEDDVAHELKIPSSFKNGIKLVGEFDIEAGTITDLVLDFDASASVVKAGEGEKYILKPTIKVIDTLNNIDLNGIVTDNQQAGLEGVTVSAQIYNSQANNAKDRVKTYTSTVTSGDDEQNNAGEYMMYLPPETYNIVAYKRGYIAQCRKITTSLDEDALTEDFELAPVGIEGNVFATVTVINAVEDQSVFISFRQPFGNDEIEAVSLNVANNTILDNISLPVGEYSVVASTDGKDPFETHISVSETGPAMLNIFFP